MITDLTDTTIKPVLDHYGYAFLRLPDSSQWQPAAEMAGRFPQDEVDLIRPSPTDPQARLVCSESGDLVAEVLQSVSSRIASPDMPTARTWA